MAKVKGLSGANPSAIDPRKTTCPIGRSQFGKMAQPIHVQIAGQGLIAPVMRQKETGEVGFSTGSLGWYVNGKVLIEVDGLALTCQVGVNVTVVGSKELPK